MNILNHDNDYVKSSFHTIAPYIGKLRPEIASLLISKYSSKDDVIFDPFCGSGTVPLEAWIQGRKTVGVDLNYYAFVLSRAKLFPYPSLEIAIKCLNESAALVHSLKADFIIPAIPEWVSKFFHPKTLREIIIWMHVLISRNDYFLISCLLGILHHQRPGFLSYPCSHGAPYLRDEKFPSDEFPEMYEYRDVYERLYKKVVRSYSCLPILDSSISREIYCMNTLEFSAGKTLNSTIITSPPYMKSLTYARDNRLRLWFLGHPNWEQIDKLISLNKKDFSHLMKKCFYSWANIQNKGNYCILVIGDILYDRAKMQSIPDLICYQAKETNYMLVEQIDYPTDINRKIVKANSQIKKETICVFQRS